MYFIMLEYLNYIHTYNKNDKNRTQYSSLEYRDRFTSIKVRVSEHLLVKASVKRGNHTFENVKYV